MKDFYLFDAGSTKTILVSCINGDIEKITLPGINPNRNINPFKQELIKIFSPNSSIPLFFYGSGLASVENKEKIMSLLSQWNFKSIEIYDDITGAARALYGKNSGILCIMGTGGLAAVYSGVDIIGRRGGYGYLIDDLGGGYELGKEILSAWLNNDLSAEVASTIELYLKVKKENFTTHYYSQPDLTLISNLTSIISEYANDEVVKGILKEYFERFIKKNVLPLASQNVTQKICVVGSLGFAFQNEIIEVFKSKGLKCEQIVKFPINGLIKYHSTFS